MQPEWLESFLLFQMCKPEPVSIPADTNQGASTPKQGTSTPRQGAANPTQGPATPKQSTSTPKVPLSGPIYTPKFHLPAQVTEPLLASNEVSPESPVELSTTYEPTQTPDWYYSSLVYQVDVYSMYVISTKRMQTSLTFHLPSNVHIKLVPVGTEYCIYICTYINSNHGCVQTSNSTISIPDIW